jgi:hypothetical protein
MTKGCVVCSHITSLTQSPAQARSFGGFGRVRVRSMIITLRAYLNVHVSFIIRYIRNVMRKNGLVRNSTIFIGPWALNNDGITFPTDPHIQLTVWAVYPTSFLNVPHSTTTPVRAVLYRTRSTTAPVLYWTLLHSTVLTALQHQHSTELYCTLPYSQCYNNNACNTLLHSTIHIALQ